jgi:hypothetical protein
MQEERSKLTLISERRKEARPNEATRKKVLGRRDRDHRGSEDLTNLGMETKTVGIVQ